MKLSRNRQSLRRQLEHLGVDLRASAPIRWARSRRRQEGLNILGHLRSEIGLGEAARALTRACMAAEIPLSLLDLPLPGRANEPEFASRIQHHSDRKGTVLVSGLDQLEDHQQRRPGLQGSVNILYPFWEVSGIPNHFRRLILRHNELWAPSTFIAQALEQETGRGVRVIHVPLRLPPFQPPVNTESPKLRFFTYLDVDSDVQRKNSAAVLRAFRDAFPSSCHDVELVIKLRGFDDDGLRLYLTCQAEEDSRIKVIDQFLTRDEMDQLLSSTDVFVSLHRSEGFGFGPAEAMAAGKAVVATDYGGTTDFVTEDTGYPVAYRMVPVDPSTAYGRMGVPRTTCWADPVHEAAVACLRAIHGNRDEAAARSTHGFALLQRQHGETSVGARIRTRLEAIGVIK